MISRYFEVARSPRHWLSSIYTVFNSLERDSTLLWHKLQMCGGRDAEAQVSAQPKFTEIMKRIERCVIGTLYMAVNPNPTFRLYQEPCETLSKLHVAASSGDVSSIEVASTVEMCQFLGCASAHEFHVILRAIGCDRQR